MINACRKVPIQFACLLLAFFLLPVTGVHAKTLDTAALKKAIAQRTVASWGDEDPYYKRFRADQVAIEKEIPIQAGDLSLFAVKAVLKAPRGAQDEALFLVVDSTGQLQFSDVLDVKTGHSFCKEALAEVRRIEKLPDDFGTLIYEGRGRHDLVVISDPFCPYCRKGWQFFQSERKKIRSLKVVHFPLHSHSELVCMALLDAEVRKERVLEMVDFAYNTLKQTAEPEGMIEQFFDAFPNLKTIWGKDAKSAMAYLEKNYREKVNEETRTAQRLGIKATPVFFIDGHMIEGYHEKQIRDRMP